MGTSRFQRFISYFYLVITKYKLKENIHSKRSEILFFNSYEKVFRKDHYLIFKKLYDKVSKENNSSKLEYKRGINFLFLEILINLFKSKGNILKLIEIQMIKVVREINFKNIEFIVVFCDTSPLQNYIVNFAINKGIKTMSLQHGFYPDIDNFYWNRIYMASNSDYFGAWDQKTINLFNNKSSIKRKYLKVGPISINEKQTNKNKNSSIKTIAIYSVGKDQQDVNRYLVSLYKYFKKNTGLNIIFISHPRFNFIDRFAYSLKNGIFFRDNSLKKRKYDYHFVLNSSVWLELELNNESFLRLDDFYLKKVEFKVLLNEMYLNKNQLESFNKNLRIHFKSSEESLTTINNFILNKEYHVF
jgi:hypothetical protein